MTVKVQQIDPCRWRIPRQGVMRTEGLVFASAAQVDWWYGLVMGVGNVSGAILATRLAVKFCCE